MGSRGPDFNHAVPGHEVIAVCTIGVLLDLWTCSLVYAFPEPYEPSMVHEDVWVLGRSVSCLICHGKGQKWELELMHKNR